MGRLLLFICLPCICQAYSLRSGLTESCHELITAEGFVRPAALLARSEVLVPSAAVPVPDGEIWRRLSKRLFENRELLPADARNDEDAELIYLSLVIGVRAPDTEGHSVTNLNSLRRIHADPAAAGQYAHALRGPDDDGPAGDIAAIEGTEQVIRELVESAREALRAPPAEQIIKVEFYVDFYGLASLDVWAPAYYLGRAAHAVQDSFSHAIRSDDLRHIRHVLNFVDAISGDLNKDRDGLPHSDAMDRCEGDTAPIVLQATEATAELFGAAAAYLDGSDPSALDDFFTSWFRYEPGCSRDNDFCDSKWLFIANQDQTGPYLGCASANGLWLAILLLLPLWRGRLSALLLVVVVSDARAEDRWPIQVEGHVSALSDAPNRSVLASTFGYGLRAGWRREVWGVFLHVERNHWVATDLDADVFAGVLDVAVGGEFLFAGGLLRSSAALGSSILLEDTVFHDAGHRGGFGDIRPIEFRWPLRPDLHASLTPLGLTVVSPVLESPSIRMIQYRTTAGVEYVF